MVFRKFTKADAARYYKGRKTSKKTIKKIARNVTKNVIKSQAERKDYDTTVTILTDAAKWLTDDVGLYKVVIGQTAHTRIGDSYFLLGMRVNMQLTYPIGVVPVVGDLIRCILVEDKQKYAITLPTTAHMFDTDNFASFRNEECKSRFRIIHDMTHKIATINAAAGVATATVNDMMCKDMWIPINKKIQLEGVSATVGTIADLRNVNYVWYVSKMGPALAGAGVYVTIKHRLYFRDF